MNTNQDPKAHGKESENQKQKNQVMIKVFDKWIFLNLELQNCK